MKKILLLLGGLMTATLSFAASDVLVVGTTGDYPPLTYLSESGYQGSDITLIKRFAKENNLKLIFKATTWSHLTQDLAAGKFDIAVGGISVNPERSKLFLLSDPINYTAKAALIRCKDEARYTSLPAIDNESTIVIENRGGTNQAFAMENIKHATLVLVSENFKALAALSESNSNMTHADVMFTDDVEIAYRHQLNPLLCQANLAEKFPATPKVFLFANSSTGKKFQQLFNRWLKIGR